VFIGNLHSTVTAGQVAHHVAAACGMKPLDVFLSRREDGTLEGFALVAMPSPEHAARLVARGLPPLLGRPLVVARRRPRQPRRGPRESTPTPRFEAHLFVGNLSHLASDKDVELHVGAVAPVVQVGLPRKRDGSGIGVAFVALERPTDAPAVVSTLDGVVFQGRRLRVELARASG